jgi:hypothetical protein
MKETANPKKVIINKLYMMQDYHKWLKYATNGKITK